MFAALDLARGNAPVTSWTRNCVTLLLRLALAGVACVAFSQSTLAGVTSSISQQAFIVDGTTASGVVRFMNGHAFEGDHGHAYASIHPDYQLSLTTRASRGMCRPAQVSVNVAFELTLPVAADAGSMSGRVRGAWNNFAAFARTHENHHRFSYLGCAQAFVAQARRQSAPSCTQLEGDVDQMLYAMKRACEVKQVPFDQSQAHILRNLSLFALARAGH